MKTVFIAGTDTGVGKTLVASHLAAYIAKKGHKAIVQKWVQTGTQELPQDISLAIKLLHIPDDKVADILPYIVPYSFSYPCSPHLAAHIDGDRILPERIIDALDYLEKEYDSVTIEGSGGLLVPLQHNYLFIDLIQKLSLPVILVVGNKLGAINHTLLSIEALKQRKISILGLIFNNLLPGEDSRIMEDNVHIITHVSEVAALGTIPYLTSPERMPGIFESIGEKIIAKLC